MINVLFAGCIRPLRANTSVRPYSLPRPLQSEVRSHLNDWPKWWYEYDGIGKRTFVLCQIDMMFVNMTHLFRLVCFLQRV